MTNSTPTPAACGQATETTLQLAHIERLVKVLNASFSLHQSNTSNSEYLDWLIADCITLGRAAQNLKTIMEGKQ